MWKTVKENPDAAFFFSVAVLSVCVLIAGFLLIAIPLALAGIIGWLVWKYVHLPKSIPVSEIYESALVQLRDTPTTEAIVGDFTTAFANRHKGNWPVLSISGAIIDAAETLCEAEVFGKLPPPPRGIEPIEEARYREFVHQKLRQAANVDLFKNALLEAFDHLTKCLPPAARCSDASAMEDGRKPGITVPLRNLLSDPGLINDFVNPLSSTAVTEVNLFADLRERLARNLHEVSGEPPDERARIEKLVPPDRFKGTFPEAVKGYLGGTALAPIFDQPVPFNLPQETRFEHHWIVAGTGHGKTQTLQTLILDDLKRVSTGNASVVVIDSQGELINNIAHLKMFAEGEPLHDKLCVIDPTDIEYPVALNLFDIGIKRMASYSALDRERLLNSAIEVLEFILRSLLGAEMTSRQSTLFRYTIQALLVIPDATIHTFRELMQPDGYAKYRPYISKLEGTAREFFDTQFNSKLFDQTKQQVVARIFTLCENRTFERLFSNATTKLSLFDEINAGHVILINTAKDLLKQTGAEVFGRFFIALLTQAAQERATLAAEKRLPTFVYVDEAQDYIANDSNVSTILEQARKQRIGLIVAHQFLGQLSASTLDSLHANTSIKFAGGVGDRDAHALARNMRAKPELLEHQPRGSFAVFIRNFTDSAMSVQFPDRLMEREPKMLAAEFQRVRDRVRARYATGRASSLQTSPEYEPRPTQGTERSTTSTEPGRDAAEDWRS
jgi:hypothetical protein